MLEHVVRLARHSAVYGMGQVLQRLASFLLLPLYTRYLSPAEYSTVELLTISQAVLVTATGLDQVAALFRTYFQHDDRPAQRAVAKTALSFYVAIALLVLALLWPQAGRLAGWLLPDASYAPYVRLTLLAYLFSALTQVPYALLRAEGRAGTYMGYSLIQVLATMLLSIYFVAGREMGAYGLLLGSALATLLIAVGFLPSVLRYLGARFSWPDLREMLAFGLPLVPAGLASMVLSISDRFFLRAFRTFDEVGLYSTGYKFGSIVLFLVITPFSLGFAPLLWQIYKEADAPRIYARILTYLSLASTTLALFLAVFATEIVQTVTAPAYWPSAAFIPWIALTFVIYGLHYVASVGINVRKKTRYMPLVVGLAAAANLGLNFWLIPIYGGLGAAWATLGGYTVYTLLAYLVSVRFYPLPLEWGRLLRLFAVAAAVYGASRFVRTGDFWLDVVLKLGLFLLFPVSLALVRFSRPEEWRQVQGLWRRLSGRRLQSQAAGEAAPPRERIP